MVRVPVPGVVKTRMAPALSPDQACELYRAFLGDLFERLASTRVAPTVFYSGEPASELAPLLPRPWPLVAQADGDLGTRMVSAFSHLLGVPGARAVLIGSDSPDLPLPYLKRAVQHLKHRDVVIGPAMDGGYYLVGLRAPSARIFEGISWGEPTVLEQTIDAIRREGLTLSMLPPWYDVDDAASLQVLRALCEARRIGGGVRLRRTEAQLARLIPRQG
ncbi:MAG TPA: TIGR04282 family arsenosugar biosynthesis glycosyltransferase [Candidatus Krumholzibacteria bacterium]